MRESHLSFFKDKTFKSWLISYVIVLLIPILIGSFMYYSSVQVIRDEISNVHNASQNQLKIFFDDRIFEIKKAFTEISVNEKVLLLQNQRGPVSTKVMYNVLAIQDQLKKIETYNDYLDGIYIYFRNEDFLLTSKGLYRGINIDYNAGSFFNMDHDAFYAMADSARLFKSLLIQPESADSSRTRVIFTQGIIANYSEPPVATIIAVLDQNKLVSVVSDLDWTAHGTIFLLNSQNQHASMSLDANLPFAINYLDLQTRAPYIDKSADQNGLIISSAQSDASDILYVSIFQSQIYLQKVQYIMNLIYIYISVVLVIGVIISYYLVRKNYKPLKKLSRMLNNNMEKASEEERNEFRFLENSVRKLLDDKEISSRRLKQQDAVIRDDLLAKLLKGQISTLTGSNKQFADNNLILDGNLYLVMLYSFEKSARFFDDAESDEKTRNLISFIVRNVVEEMTSEKHHGYMVEISGQMVCLVNIVPDGPGDGNADTILGDMMEIARKSSEFIVRNFEVKLTVSISDLQYSSDEIKTAYQQCLEADEYRTLLGLEDKIVLYRSIRPADTDQRGIVSSLDNERKFINFIVAGDYKNAESILNTIIHEDFPKNCYSLQMARFQIFGLVSSMLKAVSEIRSVMDEDFFNQIDPINRLLSAKSIVELQSQVSQIFNQVNDYFDRRQNGLLIDKADEIVEYVKANCFRSSLSISELTDVFQMSRSHVSRIFNKKAGMGLVDYIHKMRVEKAKELLRDSSRSIKDISEEVGFNHITTMIRAFRNIEGVSPGIYRNIDQQ